jgi:hypothetical protein
MTRFGPHGGRRPNAGRPTLGEAPATGHLHIRATAAQLAAYRRAAGRAGVSRWARSVLDEAARR